jgi:hypothetical protein
VRAPNEQTNRDIGCMLAHFGGNWNNGTNAGLSYWHLAYSSAYADLNIGRQTLIKNNFQNYCTLYSSPLGGNLAVRNRD